MKPDREDRSALFREYSGQTQDKEEEGVDYRLFKEVQDEMARLHI